MGQPPIENRAKPPTKPTVGGWSDGTSHCQPRGTDTVTHKENNFNPKVTNHNDCNN